MVGECGGELVGGLRAASSERLKHAGGGRPQLARGVGQLGQGGLVGAVEVVARQHGPGALWHPGPAGRPGPPPGPVKTRADGSLPGGSWRRMASTTSGARGISRMPASLLGRGLKPLPNRPAWYRVSTTWSTGRGRSRWTRRRRSPASSPNRSPVPSRHSTWSHQNSGNWASRRPASSGVRARRLAWSRTCSGSARRRGEGTLRTGLLSMAPSSTANCRIRSTSDRHCMRVAWPVLAARWACQRRRSAGPIRLIGFSPNQGRT